MAGLQLLCKRLLPICCSRLARGAAPRNILLESSERGQDQGAIPGKLLVWNKDWIYQDRLLVIKGCGWDRDEPRLAVRYLQAGQVPENSSANHGREAA